MSTEPKTFARLRELTDISIGAVVLRCLGPAPVSDDKLSIFIEEVAAHELVPDAINSALTTAPHSSEALQLLGARVRAKLPPPAHVVDSAKRLTQVEAALVRVISAVMPEHEAAAFLQVVDLEDKVAAVTDRLRNRLAAAAASAQDCRDLHDELRARDDALARWRMVANQAAGIGFADNVVMQTELADKFKRGKRAALRKQAEKIARLKARLQDATQAVVRHVSVVADPPITSGSRVRIAVSKDIELVGKPGVLLDFNHHGRATVQLDDTSKFTGPIDVRLADLRHERP